MSLFQRSSPSALPCNTWTKNLSARTRKHAPATAFPTGRNAGVAKKARDAKVTPTKESRSHKAVAAVKPRVTRAQAYKGVAAAVHRSTLTAPPAALSPRRTTDVIEIDSSDDDNGPHPVPSTTAVDPPGIAPTAPTSIQPTPAGSLTTSANRRSIPFKDALRAWESELELSQDDPAKTLKARLARIEREIWGTGQATLPFQNRMHNIKKWRDEWKI
jgi:hypothetical protein